MAKVIYVKGKYVTFVMHDGNSYQVDDKMIPRGDAQGVPTHGITYVSDATNALESFEHNKVITLPPANGETVYLNPMHVIGVTVSEGGDGVKIPWSDDFCGSVECDCGDNGGVNGSDDGGNNGGDGYEPQN